MNAQLADQDADRNAHGEAGGGSDDRLGLNGGRNGVHLFHHHWRVSPFLGMGY